MTRPAPATDAPPPLRAVFCLAPPPPLRHNGPSMFLRPFLKYFYPFKFRLLHAVLGMMTVGALAVAPLLIFREAIQVLIVNDASRLEELERAGALTPELRSLIRSMDGEPVTAAAEPESGPPSIARRVDVWLGQTLGSVYTRPRAGIASLVDGVAGWYDGFRREGPLRALGVLVVVLIVIVILKGLAEFTSKYQLAYTFFFTNLQIREDIFDNILRQDYLYFGRHSPGYLHSRINSDVKELRSILESLLSDGVQQPITLICMFGVLLWLSVPLTLGVMLLLPVIGGLLYYFARVLRRNTRKQKKKADELSSSLTESLNNIRLVKAFGTEEVETAKFHARSMELFRYMMARRVAKFGASPLMEFLGSLAAAGVIMCGGWMIMGVHDVRLLGLTFTIDQMSFADFVTYLFTLSRFYRPIKSLASLTNKYQVARVSCERMHDMLLLQPKLVEKPDPVRFERLREAIEFRDVSFSYGAGRVLDGINIRVPAGSRVAFAGASGSGKTTLINLLVRLFDPEEGAVLVDGVDLRDISLADWRSALAIVTQDTYLFDDTIANNIAYGSPVVDRRRVEEAARAAHAHDFIMALEGGKGYDTVIGPMGGRLSGGQRQRIAIARAIYRNPKILVLDEATSALDSQSQAIVQDALSRLMEGRTTFVVAHRISTIRDVDTIYMLHEGRVVESGRHDELIARGGAYAAMVQRTQGRDESSPARPDAVEDPVWPPLAERMP